jgi:dephospho-CoA kinase
MNKVGLTGGIASGKSVVCELFRAKGCHIIDADKVAHALIRKGNSCHELVVREFGRQVLDGSGEIDRKKLGEIVFTDKARLETLNSILHPEVIRTILSDLAQIECEKPNSRPIVEASLMIESGFYKSFNRLIVVTCVPRQQVERLIARNGMSEKEALQRIALQMSLAEKVRFADYVIDNSGTIEKTQEQVNQLLKKLEISVWETSR